MTAQHAYAEPPWTKYIDEDKTLYGFRDATGRHFATIDAPPRGRIAATACLIEAGPDMLAALEAARDVLEVANRYFPKSIRNRDKFSLLNTLANAVNPAIAKAKGETP